MTPAVSVVVATYNYGRFLSQALRSIQAQTFADWEALVIDDGSNDETVSVMRGFLDDARIRYYRLGHRGQPAAKNVGVCLSRAPLIAFLDADDAWMPAKLERQLALFQRDPDVGVVYTRRRFMDEVGRELERRQAAFHRGHVLGPMFRENFVCFSSATVRREVFDQVGLFDESLPLAIDYDLWLRAAAMFRFDYVDEPLVWYRTGHANLSRRAAERLRVALQIMQRFLDQRGGRERLSPRTVRLAFAETYLHLAAHEAARSRLAALPWLVKGLKTAPGSWQAWRALATLPLPESARRWLRWTAGKPLDWRAPCPSAFDVAVTPSRAAR
jgi:glycosyltransferase involved in cell wall biosynthesis